MRNLPHLTYLQAFEAAARHLSFTRAADELNCTQSAISQRVRALEQYFSRPLFHRHSNGLELSAVGKAYLPGVTEALDVAEAATQGLTGHRVVKTVTISAPVSFAVLWLSRHLSEFNSQHPDIEVRINSAIWTDPNVDLADLSIVVKDSVQLSPGTVSLGRERMTLVCRLSDAPPDDGSDSAAWINNSRLIYIQGKHQLWERWAKANEISLDPSPPPIKVDNAVGALELVAESGGVTVAFSTYCAPYLAAKRLVAPFGQGAALSLEHVLIENSQRPVTSSVRALRDWISGKFPMVVA